MSDVLADLDRQLDEILPDDTLDFEDDQSSDESAAPDGTSAPDQATADPADDAATPAQPQQQSGPADPILNQPLPKIEGMPEWMVGKPVSELIKKMQNQDELIQRQGKEKNDAVLRAEALRVAFESLQQQNILPRQVPEHAMPPAAAPTFKDVGVDPNVDLLNDPERALAGTVDLATRLTSNRLLPMIQKLESKMLSIEQQEKVGMVRNAANIARDTLRVDPQTWEKAGQYLWARASQANPFDPNSWADAWKGLTEVFPSAAARTTTPQVAMTRGVPPGASRPMTVAANPAQVKPRVSRAVSEVGGWVKEFMPNLTDDQMAQLQSDMAEGLSDLDKKGRQ